jgi:hypothetical protein
MTFGVLDTLFVICWDDNYMIREVFNRFHNQLLD